MTKVSTQLQLFIYESNTALQEPPGVVLCHSLATQPINLTFTALVSSAYIVTWATHWWS